MDEASYHLPKETIHCKVRLLRDPARTKRPI